MHSVSAPTPWARPGTSTNVRLDRASDPRWEKAESAPMSGLGTRILRSTRPLVLTDEADDDRLRSFVPREADPEGVARILACPTCEMTL